MKAWRVSLWFWWILHVGSLQGLLWEPLCKPGQQPGNQQGEQQIGGGKDYLGTNLVGTTSQEQLAGQHQPWPVGRASTSAESRKAESSGQEWQQGKDSAHGLCLAGAGSRGTGCWQCPQLPLRPASCPRAWVELRHDSAENDHPTTEICLSPDQNHSETQQEEDFLWLTPMHWSVRGLL